MAVGLPPVFHLGSRVLSRRTCTSLTQHPSPHASFEVKVQKALSRQNATETWLKEREMLYLYSANTAEHERVESRMKFSDDGDRAAQQDGMLHLRLHPSSTRGSCAAATFDSSKNKNRTSLPLTGFIGKLLLTPNQARKRDVLS